MQLSPRVHALRIPFQVPVGPNRAIDRFVFSYVVLGEDTWIIDAGVRGSAQALLQLVNELGRSSVSIKHVLLTHGHIDHVGGAAELVRHTGALIHAHPAERHWIEDLERQERERPVPGFFQLASDPVKVDQDLANDQRLELGPDLHLRVYHVPGHSPGGCAFFLEEEKILFSGDAVPVVGDMPVYDDPMACARSLARLRCIRIIRILASAWDAPRQGEEADRVLAAASNLVEEIHRAVVAQPPPKTESERLTFCQAVLEQLGLPQQMANPVVLRTFMGHLEYRKVSSLLGDSSESIRVP